MIRNEVLVFCRMIDCSNTSSQVIMKLFTAWFGRSLITKGQAKNPCCHKSHVCSSDGSQAAHKSRAPLIFRHIHMAHVMETNGILYVFRRARVSLSQEASAACPRPRMTVDLSRSARVTTVAVLRPAGRSASCVARTALATLMLRQVGPFRDCAAPSNCKTRGLLFSYRWRDAE